MNPFGVSFLVGVGVWGVAGAALAQGSPTQVTLRWSAPDECPDDARLVHQIETLLGQSLLETKGQGLGVRVSAQGNPERGYAGKISFSSARGNEERFLEHPHCEKLVEAMALVIALAIDPERVRTTQSAREAGTSLAVPAVESAPSLPERPEPMPPSPVAPSRIPEPNRDGVPSPVGRPLRGLRVALHGLAGAGALPGFGGGVQAAIGWQSPRFRVEALGRYWAPRNKTIAIAPAARVEVELSTLGARACWLLPASAWRFSACGGADLGSERGTGVGVQNPRSRDALYSQLSGGFQVAYARSQLVPEAGLEVSGALLRPGFGISQDGFEIEVFRPASWAFSAFLGFSFEL